MDLNKLESVINKFGEAIIIEMQNELSDNGSIATAELLDSLTYDYRIDAEQIIMRFLSADYAKYVEKGRSAGKYPPVSKIQDWCEVKGINIKDSFAIAKHIYKFGIQPKPFILNSFEKKKREFIIALMQVYGEEVRIDLAKEFGQLPKQVDV